jgi:HlyD family secretion protein
LEIRPTKVIRAARLVGGLLVLTLARSVGCSRPGSNEPAPGAPSAAPEVKTVRPGRRTLVRRVEQPGEIAAYLRAPLHARVSGYVKEVHKDIGDAVKAGDVLATLSVPDLVAEHEQKKGLTLQAAAEVTQAEATLGVAAARRQRAAAELERARSQVERLEKSSKGVPAEVLDESRLAFETGKAGVAEAEALQRKAVADVSVACARWRVARSEEDRLAALVGFAEIKAPFDGVVTRRTVDPGPLVQPTGGKGEPLFEVATPHPLRIYVDVPENEAALIADGTRAVVTVQALKGEKFEGHVKRSAWALEQAGRTLRTEIRLDEEDKRLRPGLYVQAVILVERSGLRAVPLTALVTQGDQTFVWCVEDGKAVRTAVTTGFRDGTHVEVLKKRRGDGEAWQDVTGDEDVIAAPPAGLADGQAVKATPS